MSILILMIISLRILTRIRTIILILSMNLRRLRLHRKIKSPRTSQQKQVLFIKIPLKCPQNSSKQGENSFKLKLIFLLGFTNKKASHAHTHARGPARSRSCAGVYARLRASPCVRGFPYKMLVLSSTGTYPWINILACLIGKFPYVFPEMC